MNSKISKIISVLIAGSALIPMLSSIHLAWGGMSGSEKKARLTRLTKAILQYKADTPPAYDDAVREKSISSSSSPLEQPIRASNLDIFKLFQSIGAGLMGLPPNWHPDQEMSDFERLIFNSMSEINAAASGVDDFSIRLGIFRDAFQTLLNDNHASNLQQMIAQTGADMMNYMKINNRWMSIKQLNGQYKSLRNMSDQELIDEIKKKSFWSEKPWSGDAKVMELFKLGRELLTEGNEFKKNLTKTILVNVLQNATKVATTLNRDRFKVFQIEHRLRSKYFTIDPKTWISSKNFEGAFNVATHGLVLDAVQGAQHVLQNHKTLGLPPSPCSQLSFSASSSSSSFSSHEETKNDAPPSYLEVMREKALSLTQALSSSSILSKNDHASQTPLASFPVPRLLSVVDVQSSSQSPWPKGQGL